MLICLLFIGWFIQLISSENNQSHLERLQGTHTYRFISHPDYLSDSDALPGLTADGQQVIPGFKVALTIDHPTRQLADHYRRADSLLLPPLQQANQSCLQQQTWLQLAQAAGRNTFAGCLLTATRQNLHASLLANGISPATADTCCTVSSVTFTGLTATDPLINAAIKELERREFDKKVQQLLQPLEAPAAHP